MATWKGIRLNENQIEVMTEKSVLIKMPKNSEFKGFVFWHPRKLVFNDRYTAMYDLRYTDEFTFKLKKYGKGRYNRKDILDEQEIAPYVLEECFKQGEWDIPPLIHKPEKLTPVKTEPIQELIDE